MANTEDIVMIECFDCGEEIDEQDAVCIDDECYCVDCIFCCDYCNGDIPSKDNSYGDNNILLCQSCYEEHYFTCESCNNIVLWDDSFSYRDTHYCEHCFFESYFYCSNCNDPYPIGHLNDSYRDLQDDQVCSDCYDDDEQNNSSRSIHDYSYKPQVIFFGNKKPGSLCFGMEIEVYNLKRKISNDDKASGITDDMPSMDGESLVYCKEDSSIGNGFEIVTHPMTFEYYKKHKKAFDEMLGGLVSDGYTSFNSKTCGIHIHLSRDSFGSFHLFKFLKMFYENLDFISLISQRTVGSSSGCCQWGKEKEYYHDDKEKMKRAVRVKARRKFCSGRYTAINLENDKTIEVRVFRGTLNNRSFHKNVEFLQAVYDFTKDNGGKEITVVDFKIYVDKHKKEFQNLYSFMKDKIQT